MEPLVERTLTWFEVLGHTVLLGSPASDSSRLSTLQLVDFSNLLNNDWLVIYSFPVIEADYQHCLDLVVFINGLPLVVFHGLHAGKEPWSLRAAYLQLQNYKVHLPKFFSFGVFDKRRFFEIIQHLIAFRQSRTKLTNRLRSH